MLKFILLLILAFMFFSCGDSSSEEQLTEQNISDVEKEDKGNNEEIEPEILPEVKQEETTKPKTEVKPEVKPDLEDKQEPDQEVKPEVKPDLEVKTEVKHDSKPEPKPDVIPSLDPKLSFSKYDDGKYFAKSTDDYVKLSYEIVNGQIRDLNIITSNLKKDEVINFINEVESKNSLDINIPSNRAVKKALKAMKISLGIAEEYPGDDKKYNFTRSEVIRIVKDNYESIFSSILSDVKVKSFKVYDDESIDIDVSLLFKKQHISLDGYFTFNKDLDPIYIVEHVSGALGQINDGDILNIGMFNIKEFLGINLEEIVMSVEESGNNIVIRTTL